MKFNWRVSVSAPDQLASAKTTTACGNFIPLVARQAKETLGLTAGGFYQAGGIVLFGEAVPGHRAPPHADKKSHISKRIQQMAGVKGKSGGPRKNAGGARPGAGTGSGRLHFFSFPQNRKLNRRIFKCQ
ncbi:hypothetical protein SAMN05216386_0482 [Nitrosospira briensis]|uniref:Uncharacterized protein n=1 Tax=Nitrosospira briensis TaxID=35799 RepID=A0A1I4Y354_9PROT|nr:hypothetical protein [Nitrosospira briensis]SFN32476.1 hypothetical protein SAMN05216386_0482 [Nitrosospira briensis]